MKILVTGASGFLGCRLVQLLYQERSTRNIDAVHVFGRPTALFHDLQPLIDEKFVIVFRGSFKDIDSIRAACNGCEVIIHSAALASDWGHPQDFYDSNVEAVENLLHACLPCRDTLKRFVHISTNDVYGYPAGGMGDETVPMHDNGISYITTKIQGEKAVHKFIRDHQLPAIILRPSNIYGPRGGSFVPVGLVLGNDRYWLGTCNYPGGLVYVDHVAQACILAAFADDSKIGQVYNVSDEPRRTWQEYFDEIATVLKIPARPRRYWRVPFSISYTLGWFFESIYRLFGWYNHHPPFTRHMALMTGVDGSCDTSKIRRDLGYRETVAFSDAVRASVEWFLKVHPLDSE